MWTIPYSIKSKITQLKASYHRNISQRFDHEHDHHQLKID